MQCLSSSSSCEGGWVGSCYQNCSVLSSLARSSMNQSKSCPPVFLNKVVTQLEEGEQWGDAPEQRNRGQGHLGLMARVGRHLIVAYAVLNSWGPIAAMFLSRNWGCPPPKKQHCPIPLCPPSSAAAGGARPAQPPQLCSPEVAAFHRWAKEPRHTEGTFMWLSALGSFWPKALCLKKKKKN